MSDHEDKPQSNMWHWERDRCRQCHGAKIVPDHRSKYRVVLISCPTCAYK